ncbi:hypothetical protein PG991_009333 [Apiospora marii]|uniref:Uncharacterized protein n=1 Tax=Apiospora marii TaxID=335849 RepID=A0ABR1RKB7_9PEZI
MSGAKRIVRSRLLKDTYLFEIEIEAGGQTQWKGEEEVQRTDDSLLYEFWHGRGGRDKCLRKNGIRCLKYHVFEILDYDFEKTTYKVQWVGVNSSGIGANVDYQVASLAAGFALGFGILTVWEATKQTNHNKNPLRSAYIWMVWGEIVANLILGILAYLFLDGTVSAG